jgi:Phycobilisome degradation protein nblA
MGVIFTSFFHHSTLLGLSIEQEFSLRIYKEQVERLDLPTTQDLLLEVLRQSMVKENLFRELIKNGI